MASFIVFFKSSVCRRHIRRINDIQAGRAIYTDMAFILELIQILVDGYPVQIENLAWHIVARNDLINRQYAFFAKPIGDHI